MEFIMPLKAVLDGKNIFAFNYESESWLELKSQPVKMPCCGAKAILKKSKLGTHFFSHYRKGDCESAPESAEHLYLKNLVSRIALKNGWEVETEKQGETPSGEKWIADVYCTKGKAKIAIEIQWSRQSDDEFRRRQAKYASSGVRALWLYRLRKNKQYWHNDIVYEYETPVFGMRMKSEKITDLYIPQFNVPIEEFITGFMTGDLDWRPNPKQQHIAEIIPHYETCWKCKKETGIVLALTIKNQRGKRVFFKAFDDWGVPDFLVSNNLSATLHKFRIGTIKNRYSRTRKKQYLSNGCYYCDALMGNFFIDSTIKQYGSSLPEPIHKFNFDYKDSGFKIRGEWYFNDNMSSMSY